MTEEVPADDALADEAAGDEAVGDEAPTEEVPDDAPGDEAAGDEAPSDEVPSDGAAGEEVPGDEGLGGSGAVEETAGEDAETDELPHLDGDELEKVLEALLLVVDSPVEEDVLATAVGTDIARVREGLNRMANHLSEHDRGLDLRRVGGGWRFYTRDKYAPYVEKMLLDGQRAKLTRAALETLAIIAYRQPVTRARVAAVRGVNCDGVIRTLLARGLVEETGTDLETGGYLYRTTELFLERLGLSSLEDLPPIAPLLPEVDSIDEV
ncbi:SMC-Scp complex subunit ScpB [Actinophytocola sp.]|uniref:SMC-Scp complex subunit ScpB n=1 Tax=Actinophytocola sp. TaxID=1872138 RepID=UPI003D6AF11E